MYMKINIDPSIFRSYDIRGVYPSTINEKSAYLIGRAFVRFLNPRGKKRLNIVVGRDSRLSSPALFKALTGGIIDQGANVIDIGLSTTPMLYWACGFYGYDGGINITASHNPKEHNGFKFVRKGAVPVSGETGLKQIYGLTQKKIITAARGKITKKKILKDYINFNLKDFNLKRFKRLKVVIDTANSVSGILIPELKNKLPLKIYPIFEKLDGSFPNHPPDPHQKKNLKWLQREIKNKRADLGIAFDGDGDRVIFVDEKGKPIGGDLITALIAIIILNDHPGEKIFYDLRSSNIVKEVIEEAGGKIVIGKLGHSFIKEQMRKENILFAGEFNGHYYLREHYFCETPFFVIFKIIEEISGTGKPLSGLIKPFKKYYRSEEINFIVRNKEKILRQLEKKYKEGKILKTDGLRVDFKNWWFNVRLSNTESLLRLNLEATTKRLMEKRRKELTKLIKG